MLKNTWAATKRHEAHMSRDADVCIKVIKENTCSMSFLTLKKIFVINCESNNSKQSTTKVCQNQQNMCQIERVVCDW